MVEEKVDAESTMYLYLEQNKEPKSIIYPNTPVLFVFKDGQFKFIFLNDIDFKPAPGQPATIVLDYGNDPTPEVAGQVHSLGYYLMRLTFQGELISTSPLIISGNRSDCLQYFNRPQRPLYSPNIKKELGPYPFNETVPNFVKFIYVPTPNHAVYSFTLLWEGNKALYVEESMDMRSFYSEINVLKYNAFTTYSKGLKELIEKTGVNIKKYLGEEIKCTQ